MDSFLHKIFRSAIQYQINFSLFYQSEILDKFQAIDIASIVLNFVIGFTVIPFVSFLAIFIDIEGGGPELYFQLLYFIPALSVLCTAAFISVRL